MNRSFILSAIIIALFHLTSCQKSVHQSSVTFEKEELTVEKGSSVYTYLLDGNGGYTWSFSNEEIAEVVSVKNGTVRIKGNNVGETVLTLTDKENTSDTLKIIVTEAETQ